MTIQQLPDFAFRSASDYALAMDQLHLRYDALLGPGIVDVLERLSVFQMFRSVWFSAALSLLVLSIIVCTLDRTPRLWRGVAEIRVAQPEPYFDPILPDRAAMTGVAEADVRSVLRRNGFRVREAADDGWPAVPVRRPEPVHEDGDAPDPPRAHPVPRGGGGHVAARRGAGPRRAGGRVADRPAHRDAGPAAREEPRASMRPASRPGRRATSRRTSPSTRTASRSPARRSG